MTIGFTRCLAGALLLAFACIQSGCTAQPVPLATTTPASQPSTVAPQSNASRGATVPWIEYEAEDGQTTGALLGPDRTFGQIAAESSGRRAVQLDQNGQYVEFAASQAANSLVVRYVIPDSSDGSGLDATLSLYIDGRFRQKIKLTSKYAWSYGGETQTVNTPGAGGAHHFYDEARALVGDIAAGAMVKLQKDDDDTATFYVIDLIDLEQVAPPQPMPAGFISITDCGATPDDATDDGSAIQACIDRATAQGQGVWIPPGTFASTSRPHSEQGIAVAGVMIQGAGMWYSTIRGPFARFHCTGNGCRFADFAILGETTKRDDSNPDNGFNGAAGRGSRMEHVWVEHTKVGWWVGEGTRNPTDGLVISGSRFRDLFADGVNLCNGASNSVVENSHFRNTGDDALASWAPASDGGVNTNNLFRFNTVQLPWRANCFAIYGGKDNRIEDSVCADVVTYPGILIAQDFKAHPFGGTTIVQRNSLLRAGGPMWFKQHGALKIMAANGPIVGLVVKDIVIDSPTFSGIQLEGLSAISDASFANIVITSPGTAGIAIGKASGDATFSDVVVMSPGDAGLSNASLGKQFVITRGAGNRGW
jgi:Alpha-1,3-glucanase catalytic domain D1/Alpha-1,3-glucanase catalytic domain D2